MACVPSHPPPHLTPSKKRKYEGDFVDAPSSTSPPLDFQSTPVTRSRSVSPALSTASTPLTELGSTPVISPSKPEMAPSDSKKRKLTFAEREVERALKRQEKEEKERQKAESKAKKEEEKKQKEVEKKRREEEKKQKDEEKKRKEEEKKAKDAVKEEKQRQKDAIKAEKEAEKGRKAAEALKKERSQMRIGAFFGRPAAASTPPDSADDVSMGTRSRRSSVASLDMAPPLIETKIREPANPEFNKWILPFFVSENMELAPFNRFHKSTTDANLPLNQGITPDKVNKQFRKRRRAAQIKPVRAILEEMNDSAETASALSDSKDPFTTIPTKYLYFHQDVRPAYQGTYTRVVSPRTSRKIAVNPTHRGLPNTDYDYDSEAEWQEPEEGDVDLMDEDEKSEDEDADEEMDDFLDDENDMLKRQTVSEMEPKSSGLCWQGTHISPKEGLDLSVYRIDVLHDSTTFPIDPFSTKHWSDVGKPSPSKREKTHTMNTQTPMQPPRLPLMAVDPNSGNLTLSSVQPDNTHDHAGKKLAHAKAKSDKPIKLIDTNLLPAFKSAVSGSTLTKIGLVEVLKQQFPKCAKDAIKNTLESVATRQGTKEAEKKWVLTD
ncbi:uncharacterized protein PV06_08892 [Exophiala oligosperma]|uniref:Chromatin assembly factor 1 subunit A n=1 Tax=Exophiala oligosperma TaxID=215243 RepID=A0A0D2AG43_9EURO|nr:uncharacterized protein PV06_08892 [Exophiala oligosperma]KIW39081.1 hypothetical protein PV06_08892 [Exophiala oligosperma]